MPWSNTSAIAIRANCSFNSGAASCTSPWTTSEVRMCTHLKGKASWFLPFNKGWNDGAGNPPNPDGLKTDYLWKTILTPQGLTDILENYAQIVEEKDEKTGKKEARADFSALSSTGRGAQAAGRCGDSMERASAI